MPDDSITVEATNGAAFAACLEQIRAGLERPTGPLNAAGRELAVQAAAAAPRRTGRLAGAHRALAAAGNRIRVTVDTPYAAVIHWGYPGHNIRRQPWAVATWLRNPRPMAAAADAAQVDIDKAAAKT